MLNYKNVEIMAITYRFECFITIVLGTWPIPAYFPSSPALWQGLIQRSVLALVGMCAFLTNCIVPGFKRKFCVLLFELAVPMSLISPISI